jgi:phosphocarrier protein HPr
LKTRFCSHGKRFSMPEITLTVEHEVGLHARPASMFVRTAKKFESEITVTRGDRTANAKSILTVLTLGAHQGAEITIQAEGADADDALTALESLVKKNFEE